MLFQISKQLIVLSVRGEVLELGNKFVHQTLYGNGNDVALDEKLGSCHGDYLDKGEGENIGQQSILPFIQHSGETGADTEKRRGKEKSVDKF